MCSKVTVIHISGYIGPITIFDTELNKNNNFILGHPECIGTMSLRENKCLTSLTYIHALLFHSIIN